MWESMLYILVFIYGTVIGSFLNVCIYRIPKGESIVFVPSHCSKCNKPIRWYDLVPVFSYIGLKGRCRNCRTHISIQYPIIEVLNGSLYVVVILLKGWSITSILNCFVISALIVLSLIDFRTYTINIGINIFILIMGIIKLAIEVAKTGDFTSILHYFVGLCAVSGFLLLLYLATGGKGIGMGDINLMAAAGLFLGWKLIILAFFIGCASGALLHTAMMKLSSRDRTLAFGPYLSFGIAIAMLYGDTFITWYVNQLF